MIKNGATDRREITFKPAAFFTFFEAKGAAEFDHTHGEDGAREGLRDDGS